MDLCQKKIEYICECHFEQMFSYPNVVGMGFGYKISSGMQTCQPVISVMVSQKQPIEVLNPDQVIPSVYYGFSTDVVETGEFTTNALTSKVRPMIFGYSIGPLGLNLAGTAGWLVRSISGVPAVYILSNNHVMANTNSLPINTSILQPAQLDGGVSTDAIARLSRYIPINFQTATSTPTNTVDAAIAQVIRPRDVSTQIAMIGVPTGIIPAFVNQAVKKSGRTTGFTTGVITNTGATVTVNYGNNRIAIFTGQIISTSMSAPGDSGSLLVDNSNRAVGLLFAGSSSVTIYNPISTVISALSVGLITAYGVVTG